MKKIIILIGKIIFIIIIIIWLFLVVIDYKRAKEATKPVICLTEKTEEWTNGTYYECVSFGYKYYEFLKPNNVKDYGFISILSKNPVREKYGVHNE